jgi:hypothetical protein
MDVEPEESKGNTLHSDSLVDAPRNRPLNSSPNGKEEEPVYRGKTLSEWKRQGDQEAHRVLSEYTKDGLLPAVARELNNYRMTNGEYPPLGSLLEFEKDPWGKFVRLFGGSSVPEGRDNSWICLLSRGPDGVQGTWKSVDDDVRYYFRTPNGEPFEPGSYVPREDP